jgi:chromosome partitioning protein
MKTIIAIANQKGGTAKTTSTAALGVQLARRGVPVHMVDMDPQANLSQAFGVTDSSDRLYHAISQRAQAPVVQLTERLTISPASVELARLESELLTEVGREWFLKTALMKTDELSKQTIVLIDCPPSLGVLSVNALVASNQLLVVVQPGGFELQALLRLHWTVQAIQQRANADLRMLGTLLTNCQSRRKITKTMESEIRRHQPVIGTIRADAQLLYATTEQTLLTLKRSRAMDDYARAADRILELTT